MSDRPSRVDTETTKQGGNFLFKKGESDSDSEYLDMRSRINSDSMSEMLLYYGILGNAYGSEIATKIKDTVERLLIARKGAGREEAVKILQQNFPKRIEIEKGYDE